MIISVSYRVPPVASVRRAGSARRARGRAARATRRRRAAAASAWPRPTARSATAPTARLARTVIQVRIAMAFKLKCRL